MIRGPSESSDVSQLLPHGKSGADKAIKSMQQSSQLPLNLLLYTSQLCSTEGLSLPQMQDAPRLKHRFGTQVQSDEELLPTGRASNIFSGAVPSRSAWRSGSATPEKLDWWATRAASERMLL